MNRHMLTSLISPVISRFALLGILFCAATIGQTQVAKGDEVSNVPGGGQNASVAQSIKRPEFILDMVHHNPGEPKTESAFRDPHHLFRNGYNGQVTISLLEAAVTFDSLDPEIFPKDSPSRHLVS